MSAAHLDVNLPAENSPLSSDEMRVQFQAIKNQFDHYAGVAQLGLSVSNPPTQAEVQAIADKLDEVIAAMQEY